MQHLNKSMIRLFALFLGVVFLLAASSAHSAGWFDGFGNGSIIDSDPVTWTFNEIGASPGDYDASSGDLILSAPGDPSPIIPTEPSDNSLVPSVEVVFDDTYARTQVMTLPDDPLTEARGNAGVVVRWNPATITGYVVLLDHGNQLEVLRLDGGAPTPLDIQQDIGINTLVDAVLEVSAVGSEISIYAWNPHDPKPTTPVSTVNDSTYSSGRAGLFFNEDSDGHLGVFRFATAQDVPFVTGDFDFDGDVDQADLSQWQSDYGISGRSDTDFDGESDGADFLAWQRNFTTGLNLVAVASIPEPGALPLSLLALISLCSQPRNRS